jgi:hypothetical protein
MMKRIDEMNQNKYNALIDRVRNHCQQIAQDAGFPNSDWDVRGNVYLGRYVPEWKSFIALKKENDRQEPVFVFSRATEQQIVETEQQLGFPLPVLLRLLYKQVANGGFGPGYGIIGAVNGFPSLDNPYGNIAQRYHQEIEEANENRQRRIKAFIKADQENQQRTVNEGEEKVTLRVGPDGKVAPEWERTLTPVWPERLLPLCEWGDNITTYIYADTEQVFQGMGGADLFIAASLEEWLERWLDGEDLQFL